MPFHDDRYTIIRKLGEGSTATTWLVHDARNPREISAYNAVKILTAEATQDVEHGLIRELEFLIDAHRRFEHVPILLDHLTVTGPAGDRHLCLVQNLHSTSVSALRRSSPTNSLPVYMVRHLIYMALQGLTALHSLNILHTELRKFLADNPVEMANGFPKSQPIPHKWTYNSSAYETELISVTLGDLGHAQRAGEQPMTDLFSALALRAPELIGFFSCSGYMGDRLPCGEPGWNVEDDHLAKMMELTGQRFPPDMIARAKNRDKYFDNDGNLLRIHDLKPITIEQAMRNYKIPGLTEHHIGLDYKERATSSELILHPFLQHPVDSC
ncbi:kinase-like domain-containing protein [Lentinula aff. lateritia]|uniref:Kinase-like domain-containing protein n=1 Tax=Lentinula aff. lateritia TaxID=2804960 RepID=A0ACC1TTL8_9AGAR|nr:kinase-like domain-containing protein [Lentinula aff. lateritia]